MDPDLAERARASARGWASLAKDNLVAVLAAEDVDRYEITVAVEELGKRISYLDKAQADCEVYLKPEDLDKDIEKSFSIVRDLQRTKQRGVKRLESMSVVPIKQEITDEAKASPSTDFSHLVKLPKLELPKFSGEATEWLPFWEKFEAVVDKAELPVVSKLTYLHTLLEGEAELAIAGLSVTEAHYKTACKVLQDRFGRREKIIFSHIQGLLNLSISNTSASGGTTSTGSKQKPSRLSNLWTLYDKLQSHVRSLETLEIGGKDYGVFLTPVVLSRLPHDIRMEWARDCSGHESDLEWLLKFLQAEIERRERSDTFRDVTSDKADERRNDRGRTGNQGNGNAKSSSTAVALQTSGSVDFNCGICDRRHPTEKCWDLTRVSLVERKNRVREANLCFRCLKRGHMARTCSAKCGRCRGRHHFLFCTNSSSGGGDNAQGGSAVNSSSGGASSGGGVMVRPKERVTVEQPRYNGATGTGSGSGRGGDTVLNPNSPPYRPSVSYVGVTYTNSQLCTVLQTAKVKVMGARGIATVNLLFDSGSDHTYTTSSLVKKIGPKWLGSENMSYVAFGGDKPSSRQLHNVYSLNLQGLNGVCEELRAVEVPVICTPLQRPQIPRRLLQSFGEIQFADYYGEVKDIPIDILVGLDSYWKFFGSGLVRLEQGPVAQETIFGWIVSGSWQSQCHGPEAVEQSVSISHRLLCLSDIPDQTLRSFWELESIGIVTSSDESSDLDPVMKNLCDTIEYKDGRYVVGLPWKEGFDKAQLLDNESIARSRLKSLTRKLSQNLELQSRYNAVFQELENTGIICEVPEVELCSSHPVFYMPHHPVVKEASLTTKVRPVFDASAQGVNGISLNDCLDAGPSLIPSLVDILIRFRRWQIALTGDITKAFLQIGVSELDQDVHRFLWNDGERIRVMKFRRVPFGNKSSPFLLNATVKFHLSQYPPSRAVEELGENLYVDDWITGADTVPETCDLFQEGSRILSEASFPLAKTSSSSREVSQLMFKDTGSKLSCTDVLKVLGLKWSRMSDVFSFDVVILPSDLLPTKRVILSCLARLFDPLGFIAPFSIVAKMLVQEIWQLGLGWDENLPSHIENRFVTWAKGLEALSRVEISRCYTETAWSSLPTSSVELCAFGDASEKGYGACIYLRVLQSTGLYKVSLVVSKAKVAPIKRVTLPRLELLGALLAARLVVFTLKALKLPEVVFRCYSDSTVALAWIRGKASKWKPFVANRVSEIQQLTPPSCWSHCQGVENPADALSRGMMAEELVASKTWWFGPSWLSEPIEPSTSCSESETVILPPEEEKVGQSLVTVETPILESEVVLKPERWGTFNKAVRVTGYVLRFIKNLKGKVRSQQESVAELTKDELSVAQTVLFRSVQSRVYSSEIVSLRSGNSVAKNSPLYRLNPFIDDVGMLRVKGRLQKSELTYEEKHPLILPNCHLSRLLVGFEHERLKHAGVDTMITSIRCSFWIVGLRKIAKGVKRNCVRCRRVDAAALNQSAAPLPAPRVNQTPPFSVTGMDYAGPLFCVDLPSQKLYILLFTCAVIRAIHLELTLSLSLSDFMLAFKRFSARRGLPTILYSDNAKTFVGAESLLAKELGPNSPKWNFIVPKSPWWGGWWERLVRSVKGALKKSIGSRRLTRCELETTLAEVEACVNSRPLTYVGDLVENSSPLTPSHFLIGRPAGYQVAISEVQHTVTPKGLSEREAVRQQRLNEFWSLWSADYLRNLPPTVNRFRPRGEVSIGSAVVLIREDNLSRLKWPLGIVTGLFPGRDGIVRSVQLNTAKGPLVRSIQRLHDLEVHSQPMVDCGEAASSNDLAEVAVTGSGGQAEEAVVTGSDGQVEEVVAVGPSDPVEEVEAHGSSDLEEVETNDPVEVGAIGSSNQVEMEKPSEVESEQVDACEQTATVGKVKSRAKTTRREGVKTTRSGRVVKKPERLDL